VAPLLLSGLLSGAFSGKTQAGFPSANATVPAPELPGVAHGARHFAGVMKFYAILA
jgi:hypothetical protein